MDPFLPKLALLAGSAVLILEAWRSEHDDSVARRRAFSMLASISVFVWADYGALRGEPENSWVTIVAAVALILLAAFIMRSGFREPTSERGQRLRAWLSARREQLKLPETWGLKALTMVTVVVVSLGFVIAAHAMNIVRIVHAHEQFHFYVAAKYQREVGWFDLYRSAVIADRETVGVMRDAREARDNSTFELESIDQVLAQTDRVKARFSPERWEAFKADWVTLTRTSRINWNQAITDHGNSNSPAWSVIAHPIAQLVPLTPMNQSILGCLDLLLMLVMFLFVFDTFGARVAAPALFFWAIPANVFDYLAGSFLRWDWLFALGMAACFIKREKWATAGAFFGYAVATKLFPLFFGVGLLMRAVLEWKATRSIPQRHLRFAGGTFASGALLVVLATLMFGPSAWKEYKQRIDVAQTEKFYNYQYSLKTVFLQVVESRDGEFARTWAAPDLKQARREVDIANHAGAFLFVELLFTALIFLLVRRATELEAFLIGPLLVFVWLTVNMYYWNMLGLLALGLATRTTSRSALVTWLGVHAAMAAVYWYEHVDAFYAQGYIGALVLSVTIVVAAIVELRQRTPPQTAPERA